MSGSTKCPVACFCVILTAIFDAIVVRGMVAVELFKSWSTIFLLCLSSFSVHFLFVYVKINDFFFSFYKIVKFFLYFRYFKTFEVLYYFEIKVLRNCKRKRPNLLIHKTINTKSLTRNFFI